MSLVYLDSNVYIYSLNDHPQLGDAAQTIFRRLKGREHQLCASLFTVGELLVQPLRIDDEFRVASLRRFFRAPEVLLLPFTPEASLLYARLRARDRVKPLDALHLACAATGGVDLFVTNDRGLTGLRVPGIGAIVTMDVSF